MEWGLEEVPGQEHERPSCGMDYGDEATQGDQACSLDRLVSEICPWVCFNIGRVLEAYSGAGG